MPLNLALGVNEEKATEMLASFLKRPLGSVYWLEAPAILLMFLVLSFVLGVVLREKGGSGENIGMLRMALVLFGNIIAGGYIWLVSRNTSKALYTWLARASVLFGVAAWLGYVVRAYP